MASDRQNVEAIRDSLLGGCKPLDVGAAGRSNSPFSITADSKWVLKQIRMAEKTAFFKLTGADDKTTWSFQKPVDTVDWINDCHKRQHLSLRAWQPNARYWFNNMCKEEQCVGACVSLESPQFLFERRLQAGSLLLPFAMLDEKSNVVAMPNFIKSTTDLARRLFPEVSEFSVFKYDVKPLEVPISKEREALLGLLLRLEWLPASDTRLRCGGPCHKTRGKVFAGSSTGPELPGLPAGCSGGRVCFEHLHYTLASDLRLLAEDRAYRLVDYSLAFTIAIPKTDDVIAEPEDASAILSPNCVLSYNSGLGTWPKLLCVYVIDYLKERGLMEKFDSWRRGGKFNQYARRSIRLLRCVFNLFAEGCEDYRQAACQGRKRSAHAWCTTSKAGIRSLST